MSESLAKELQQYISGRTVVLGIGNPLRGDDAVGTLLAERLSKEKNFTGVATEEMPENYTGVVRDKDPQTIILVDAVDFNGEPGDVVLMETVEFENRFSSHRPSLGLLMHYLSTEIKAKVFLLGIQPKRTGYHSPLSDEVQETLIKLEEIFKGLSKIRT
jgi:hydrogenase 3 maturation protease